MIPRFRPWLGLNDLSAVIRCESLSLQEFESRFAREMGFGYAVWFPWARLGAQIFLQSLVTAQQRVTLSAFNCIALGRSIVRAGWTPVYVDTEAKGFNQDADQFARTMNLASTGAGIWVSQWGIPAVPPPLPAKPLLHDFALRGLDRDLPKLREQDGILFSLGWGKPLGTLRGGVLCGNSGEQASAWRSRRDEALLPSAPVREALDYSLVATALHPKVFGLARVLKDRTPLGTRLTGRSEENEESEGDWLALSGRALGLSWMRVQAREVYERERERQIEAYGKHLGPFASEALLLPPLVPQLSHFPIRVRGRTRIRDAMIEAGIYVSDQLFDRLLPEYPDLKGETSSALTMAKELTQTSLHFPLYSGMPEDVPERIAAVLRKVLT